MEEADITQLTFKAHYIESFEINHEMASHCKLRSKFVHEKIFKARVKECVYSVLLLISKQGVKVVNQIDQVILSSHPIQRISYSACDRLNRLFALVVRSTGVIKGQLCYIFRMDTSEQADSINRYFGSIFKQLHNQKKDKRIQKTLAVNAASTPSQTKYENVTDLFSSLGLPDPDDPPEMVFDSRLRQISTSNINELVSEKHNIRRLSLSIPGIDPEHARHSDPLQPLHSSLEKPCASNTDNVTKPVVRRKKPDNKGNRISAAIERWSFRASRDLSTDFLKSGSPVVALKEKLEYEDLLSADTSFGSDPPLEQCSNSGALPHSHSKKQILPSHLNLSINNDFKANNNIITKFLRKNSAPICNPVDDEQPPVPPVRIHSLRNTTGPRTEAAVNMSVHERGCGEGASQSIPGCYDDDDLSSITTPSSCDQAELERAKFSIYNEPPPVTKPNREATHINAINSTPPDNSHSNIALEYFRNCNKEEAMAVLLEKEVGGFLLRPSGSHRGCLALSVKVAHNLVSHYILEHTAKGGIQMRGLDKTWPSLQSLITHLSVIPELLPCPIRIAGSEKASVMPGVSVLYSVRDGRRPSAPASYLTQDLVANHSRQRPPPSQSADHEYRDRMQHFLSDLPSPGRGAANDCQDQYQQLSDFSSIIASLDLV